MLNVKTASKLSFSKFSTRKLSFIYSSFLIIIAGSYFLHPILPIGITFIFCILAFRHWIRFDILFYAIMVMFLLVSPNVPPHEKHFRSPILLKEFLAQDILLFAALFLFAIAILTQKITFPKPKTFTEKAFLLFVISFLCSFLVGLLQNNRSEYVISEARDFAYLLLFWLILVYASRFERLSMYVFVFVGCCALFAVISVIDAAVRYKFSRYNSGISFLLLGGFFFCLSALIVRAFEKHRTLLIGLLITFLVAIVVSFTRGLYLGLVVGLLVVMIRTGAAQTVRLVFFSVLMLGGVAGVLFLFNLTPDFLIEQTVNRGTEVAGGIDVSSAERVLEVIAVLNDFPNHPIFGDGVGGTIRVYRFTDLVGKAGMTDWWFIHNNYFQTLHKHGTIGITALLLLWISAIWKSYRLYKVVSEPKKKALLLMTLGTLVGFMAISMTSAVMTYSNTNFLNALLFAVVVIIEREQEAHRELAAQQ